MSVLDDVAADAVKRAISVVADQMIRVESSWDQDKIRELVLAKCREIMLEPDVEKRVRAKLIEIIDGMPNSIPSSRGRY